MGNIKSALVWNPIDQLIQILQGFNTRKVCSKFDKSLFYSAVDNCALATATPQVGLRGGGDMMSYAVIMSW